MPIQQIQVRRRDTSHNSQIDSREYPAVVPHGLYTFNGRGGSFIDSQLRSFTYFELLPAAAVAAGTEKLFTLKGANTPVAAQSTTGGLSLTTGAANTNMAAVGAVAATGMTNGVTATNNLRFSTRVNLTTIAALLAGFGLDQTPADVNPTAAGGDGATFIFDPTILLASGLPAAAQNNFILFTKVGGAATYLDSGIKVIAATDYDLGIEIDGNLQPNFFINGVLVGVGPALTAAVNLGVIAGVKTLEAVLKNCHIRFTKLSRLIG